MQYIQTYEYQHKKLNNAVCGDNILIKRGKNTTAVIVADGVGSGVHANICANMFTSELMYLLEKEYSLLEACRLVLNSIKAGRKIDNFAALTAATILHTGHAHVVCYEAPTPVFINNNFAYVPQTIVHKADSDILLECDGLLGPGKAMLLFSDGISQSGMGHGLGFGIGSKGAADKVNELLARGASFEAASEGLLGYCKQISAGKWEDDTSLVLVKTRSAVTANILTGPPFKKDTDKKFIDDFIGARGFKIICGSTTLDVYCRVTNSRAELQKNFNPFEAPTYKTNGIDFASEGALMLNQLYNLYELNPKNMDSEAPIVRLKEILDNCDKIVFYLGLSENTAQNESMIFSQLRVFPRRRIIEMLASKFRDLGKVVHVREY
jgi:hypothetical protein